jgi:solute carrier family 9 (sodium/hydrogen exchanger), member 8
MNHSDSSIRIIANESIILQEDFDAPQEIHDNDAYSTTFINLTLISCLLLAYFVKQYRLYCLPESAGALIIGVIVGGIVRLVTNDLQLFVFVRVSYCKLRKLRFILNSLSSFPFLKSPEVFFFVFLPPIMFEAGYSLNRKDFFENFGAINLFAMLGTIISTFVVGLLTFYVAKQGLIKDIDKENPMEALLFGALISAVDPVATLSIMGNADLQVNPLLYSLVFGESVLNDAVAVVLFKTFHKYYSPDGPEWREAEIPAACMAFASVTVLSIILGVTLGLVASLMYKHTQLSDYPKLETSLLFCFCYLCYSTAESMNLSGIMAIFFQGIILSHYNSYNLSPAAHVASEQIFSTVATVAETTVFLYMGMGVFTGRFANWDILFSVLALSFCILGRLLNIFPLSLLANLCRNKRENKITCKMQGVLWFAGLRGAIAFALAENMPGPNKDVYATATLSICIFTTVVCGGLTDRILKLADMKYTTELELDTDSEDFEPLSIPSSPRMSERVYDGVKGVWKDFDDKYLKLLFGGSAEAGGDNHYGRRHYEMASRNSSGSFDTDDIAET